MRVLFCGLGGIGQRHLRNLRDLIPAERLEIHAYRVRGRDQKLRDDLTVEESGSLVDDYKIIVHKTIQEALACQPKAVFICNPSSMHTAIALEAARSGAHLFIEKPVAHAMDGLDELFATVKANNLVCYVGYNFRYHPALQKLKALIDSRAFGNILGVHSEIGEYLPNWHRYEDYREMYAARSELGGGVILSQIHEMDLIYWFFGLPNSILCVGGKLSRLDVDVEDVATSLMQIDGPLGRFPIVLHQDFIQRPPVRMFKVFGDQGSALVNLLSNSLQVYDENGDCVDYWDGSKFKRNDMFLKQMQHFLACVDGHEPPSVNLWDGMQSLRLAIAAKESLKNGQIVPLLGEEL